MHSGSHGDGGPGICTMVTFCLSILFFSSYKTFVRDTCQGP